MHNFLCADSQLVSVFFTCCSSCLPVIALNGLEPGKLYVYSPDKTLVYTFDSVEQAARELTASRCSHLSDLEISQRKNIRYIRRVINKGVITTTEKGKFYLYQKSNHSICLSLVSWGQYLSSTVGTKLISKQERSMVEFPSFQFSVIIGLLLSDGYLQLQTKNRSINSCLRFKQSLDKSQYV